MEKTWKNLEKLRSFLANESATRYWCTNLKLNSSVGPYRLDKNRLGNQMTTFNGPAKRFENYHLADIIWPVVIYTFLLFSGFSGFFQVFSMCFQSFLNREIDFYIKNWFFDQKSILQNFIKFRLLDTRKLILDSQNGLEWSPEQTNNSIFFQNFR